MCVNCGSTGCGGCQPVIPTSPAGAAGKNAYTLTTASFTMPAVGDNVIITVSTTGQFGNGWAKALQVIAVTGAGYFQVVSTTGLNQITITNLGYAPNAIAGATIASGATVAPAGLQGLAGTTGGTGTNGTTRLYEVLNTSTAGGTGAYLTFALYSVPANTLVNTGDALIIEARITQVAAVVGFDAPSRQLLFAAQSCTFVSLLEPFMLNASADGQYRTRVEIIKTGAATAMCRIEADIAVPPGAAVAALNYQVDLTGLDFTISNQLQFGIKQFTASGTELRSFTVDKIVSQ